jgi:hypothetical protein
MRKEYQYKQKKTQKPGIILNQKQVKEEIEEFYI